MFIFYLFVYFLTLKDIIVPVETKLLFKCTSVFKVASFLRK